MKQLRKKEIKELNEEIKNNFNIEEFFDKKDKVVIDNNAIIKDDKALFFYHKNKIVPTLKLLLDKNFLPKVTVDMGAVKFIINGADIMRPGIVDVEEFDTDAAIAIIDETHKKPLAVGIALLSSEDIKKQEKSKSVKCIHYIGDNIYRI